MDHLFENYYYVENRTGFHSDKKSINRNHLATLLLNDATLGTVVAGVRNVVF